MLANHGDAVLSAELSLPQRRKSFSLRGEWYSMRVCVDNGSG